MKIGVVSDTHIPTLADELPARVFELLAGVDLILHAGDIVALSVLDELRRIAPVEVVRGNMDQSEETRALPRRKIIEAASFRIGLIHGFGAPIGMGDRVVEEFAADRVDAIVFGHTHQPTVEQNGRILLLNPGSPTDRLLAPYLSVGLLELDGTLTGRILKF